MTEIISKYEKFVGFDNYLDVFKRDDCFRALWLSLYYMGGAVIQLALALYLATVFCFGIKGGNFFKGCMFFPYLINGIAIGFIFKFFYTRAPLYNFTNDTLVSESTVLRHLLRHLILYQFRLFP